MQMVNKQKKANTTRDQKMQKSTKIAFLPVKLTKFCF